MLREMDLYEFLSRYRLQLAGAVVIVLAGTGIAGLTSKLFPSCEKQWAEYEEASRKNGTVPVPKWVYVKPSCESPNTRK